MKAIQEIKRSTQQATSVCYHCGDNCGNSAVHFDGKEFCCIGCKTVYQLLEDSGMCAYYDYAAKPGITPAEAGVKTKFQYLEDEDIRKKLVNFSDGNSASVTFYIPSIHCSSCVWLLENLSRLNPLIQSSRVNFLKKEVQINYEETATSLRQVVELLSSIRYEPQINLDSLEQKKGQQDNRDLYIKIGVAGFSFGNIMLFHFPEYLSAGQGINSTISSYFNLLSFALALPVLFYSSSGYFKSAIAAFKQRMVNMDVPISLGILTLFIRSSYDIFVAGSSGYMDSFAGLVFLLLVGKLFEKKTYDSLSFERDYKSYFPVSVTKKVADGETTIPLERLKTGDRIFIRNQELIPADSILINGNALIDYSFVTGEAEPVLKKSGDMIYAGGKQEGTELELDVVHEVNQSYLTELWNDEAFSSEQHHHLTTAANVASRYFTLIVLLIAVAAALYWLQTNWITAFNAFTAVLIVACPCALALSTPFTLGNTLRVFGWNKFYLKNTNVIETMSGISHIVFDKTGTLTSSRNTEVTFSADLPLSVSEKKMVSALARQSMHPLSQYISDSLNSDDSGQLSHFEEIAGKGISAKIDGIALRLGSANFVRAGQIRANRFSASAVHLAMDGVYRGSFVVNHGYRPGLAETIEALKPNTEMTLLSGDNDRESKKMESVFGSGTKLYFNQTPYDKLKYVKKLQQTGQRVLMIGDGLNDAGALRQSDVGVTLSENVNGFSPASDAILNASEFQRLPEFIRFSRWSMRIILISFVISFIYNVGGMFFAVRGTLSPLIAAILMPASSISVVLFTTGSVILLAKKLKFKLVAEKGNTE